MAIENRIHNQLPKVSFSVLDENDIFDYNSVLNKTGRVSLLVFSILIFPAGLTRLVGKAINYFITKNFVLPSLKKNKKQLDLKREEFLKNPEFAARCKRKVIETADNVKLDTMLIVHPEQKKKEYSKRKYIVFLNNNKETYESMLPSLMNISNETGASVYTGNYRGVGHSHSFPSDKQNLFMDAEAMVQRLLIKGVHVDNILVHGWDIGACVGTHVVALHQEEGYRMNLCSDRSCVSTVNQIKECANKKIQKLKKQNPKKAKLITRKWTILAFLSVQLTRLFGWNFKNLESYNEIDGHKFIIYHRHDASIPYKASLYKEFKESKMTATQQRQKLERKVQKIIHKMQGKEYIRDLNKRNYRPENAIRLGKDLNEKVVHEVSIDQTKEFNDYKDQVAIALS